MKDSTHRLHCILVLFFVCFLVTLTSYFFGKIAAVNLATRGPLYNFLVVYASSTYSVFLLFSPAVCLFSYTCIIVVFSLYLFVCIFSVDNVARLI